MTAEGDTLSEGNMNEGRTRPSATVSTVAEPTEPDNKSFAWRGGSERQTTGIWVWSEPFVKVSSSGQPVAVILMDTQGMFDNETSMALTAQIFGLSTFVSSFQASKPDQLRRIDVWDSVLIFSSIFSLTVTDLELCRSTMSISDSRKIICSTWHCFPNTADWHFERDRHKMTKGPMRC